jgi:NADH-quinone oxidoreductase subunit L
MLGIIMVWAMTNGTVHFGALEQAVKANPALFGTLSGVVGLLIFCGAMGKSAQFPLHVWLPDAMEGPTPVSALIHAATMVAAGVYMLCRVFFLYTTTAAWPESMAWLQGVTAADIIAWIGGITSLLAAFIAVQQNDIKRILAYSTLSQLGYMVMAVGLGGPEAALYHLTTHAAFKALLFLGAGAVIHSLHHEQDIWRMGGLRSRMPITYWTFLAGTLSLSGVPPFSGFFSKDEVLATAAHHSIALFIMALLVAVLTTFYMFRLFFVAFRGAPRSEAADHAHEAPGIMTWPLIILSIPTLLAGLWGIDHFLEAHFYPGAVAHHGSWAMALFAPFGHSPLAAMLGLGAVFVGFTLACSLYSGATRDPLPLKLSLLSRALRRRLYFDEIYQGLINLTHENFARLSNWIDRWLIGGLAIRGLHGGVEIFGRILRLVQTGNLQTYAFLFLLGVAGLLYFFLYR